MWWKVWLTARLRGHRTTQSLHRDESRCGRAAGHRPSHLSGQWTWCLCRMSNNNPEPWPWHHTDGDPMASSSMATNGTDCVSLKTLAGSSGSKSPLVESLFYPSTAVTPEGISRVKCCCYCWELHCCSVSRDNCTSMRLSVDVSKNCFFHLTYSTYTVL